MNSNAKRKHSGHKGYKFRPRVKKSSLSHGNKDSWMTFVKEVTGEVCTTIESTTEKVDERNNILVSNTNQQRKTTSKHKYEINGEDQKATSTIILPGSNAKYISEEDQDSMISHSNTNSNMEQPNGSFKKLDSVNSPTGKDTPTICDDIQEYQTPKTSNLLPDIQCTETVSFMEKNTPTAIKRENPFQVSVKTFKSFLNNEYCSSRKNPPLPNHKSMTPSIRRHSAQLQLLSRKRHSDINWRESHLNSMNQNKPLPSHKGHSIDYSSNPFLSPTPKVDRLHSMMDQLSRMKDVIDERGPLTNHGKMPKRVSKLLELPIVEKNLKNTSEKSVNIEESIKNVPSSEANSRERKLQQNEKQLQTLNKLLFEEESRLEQIRKTQIESMQKRHSLSAIRRNIDTNSRSSSPLPKIRERIDFKDSVDEYSESGLSLIDTKIHQVHEKREQLEQIREERIQQQYLKNMFRIEYNSKQAMTNLKKNAHAKYIEKMKRLRENSKRHNQYVRDMRMKVLKKKNDFEQKERERIHKREELKEQISKQESFLRVIANKEMKEIDIARRNLTRNLYMLVDTVPPKNRLKK